VRWPWQPRPGMRRVKHRDLIELQRGALQAAALEANNSALNRERRLVEAKTRALELLAQRWEAFGVDVDPGVRDDLLAGLPLTAEDALLHEAAFSALVESCVWAERERELAGRSLTRGGTQTP